MNASAKCAARRPNPTRKTRIALTLGCLAVGLVGCANPATRIEYIPSDRAVMPLKKGQPAPSEGWFVPPAVLQEMIPYLDEKYRSVELLPAPPARKTEQSETQP